MKPTFVQFPQGQYAYNTDLNNFAPSIGAAWSVPASTGFLSKLLGREEGDSVFRGGFGTAYERPGMSNFTDVFGTNPGLRITGVTDRTETNGNLAVGALLRNPAQVSTPNFNTTPSYPITASIGQSVNIMDSNLQDPVRAVVDGRLAAQALEELGVRSALRRQPPRRRLGAVEHQRDQRR